MEFRSEGFPEEKTFGFGTQFLVSHIGILGVHLEKDRSTPLGQEGRVCIAYEAYTAL